MPSSRQPADHGAQCSCETSPTGLSREDVRLSFAFEPAVHGTDDTAHPERACMPGAAGRLGRRARLREDRACARLCEALQGSRDAAVTRSVVTGPPSTQELGRPWWAAPTRQSWLGMQASRPSAESDVLLARHARRELLVVTAARRAARDAVGAGTSAARARATDAAGPRGRGAPKAHVPEKAWQPLSFASTDDDERFGLRTGQFADLRAAHTLLSRRAKRCAISPDDKVLARSLTLVAQ
jgi:hypothetical protein